MDPKELPDSIDWQQVRVLSIDGAQVTLRLEGETNSRVFCFESVAERDDQLKRWFAGWTD